MIEDLILNYSTDFESGFVAESPGKLRKMYDYYSALQGFNDFPLKKCNAPWVSAVVEADCTVRPCFFHESIGNIRQNDIEHLLNKKASIKFRKELDLEKK